MADLSRLLVSKRPIELTFAGPRLVSENLHQVLQIVKPTDFIAVPRVYEKWQSLIELRLKQRSTIFKGLYRWATYLGQ